MDLRGLAAEQQQLRTSPGNVNGNSQNEPARKGSSSSTYGGDYGGANGGTSAYGFTPWNTHESSSAQDGAADDIGDEADFINPMTGLSLAPSATVDYAPKPAVRSRNEEEDDEDDLGFGNRALSRARTPKPGDAGAGAGEQAGGSTEKVDAKATPKAEASTDLSQKSKCWVDFQVGPLLWNDADLFV
jgi:hypothetical protein